MTLFKKQQRLANGELFGAVYIAVVVDIIIASYAPNVFILSNRRQMVINLCEFDLGRPVAKFCCSLLQERIL